MGASDLREHWLERAFAHAGIDRSRWRPNVGVADNRVIIEAVYAYYGRLYLDDPAFLWAGMASLVGPAFYAGFDDVGALPDRVRRLVSERALRRGDDPVAELSYYETTFLRMQQKIFEDQALMHEAYLERGLAGVRELGGAGIIDTAMVRAWTQIASGGPDAIAAGNRALLLREQFQIIDRYYHHMYERRGPEGGAITYLMTLVGEPSLPGARAYAAVFPLTLGLDVGRGQRLSLATPAADGNIAVFADRWRLITLDTLPAYRRLLATDTERARTLMATPIAQRVGRYRLLRRLGHLALNSAVGWRVRLAPAAPAADPDREQSRGALAVGEEVVLDLRTAPARERTLRLADGAHWARPGRSFDLTVLLPESQAFRTMATLLMLDDETTTRVARLAVTLGLQDGLEGAARTLRGLAGEWGLDPVEVEDWREHAASVSATHRHLYSTRVFQGRDVDGVQVEFQVEHHVAEREFVLHAFFSWQMPVDKQQA